MEESKLNILKAKVKGYVTILKGLSEEIKNAYSKGAKISKNVKLDESDFETSKETIGNLEEASIEISVLSQDVDKYLFKTGILYNVVVEFGDSIEFEDEESNQILKLAETYSKDKEAFTFSMLDGKKIVMNEEMHSDMINNINHVKSDTEVLKHLYEKAQKLMSKAK